MDVEVKQRNRRRRRAQRMQAQREGAKTDHLRGGGDGGDSGDDDEHVIREKPQRPPNRRKKTREPLVEEDIVEGFSILQFRSYEDLELVLKISSKENIKRLCDIERPKHESKSHITHHISVHNNHGISLTQDPATSDDSGRASERLTGSSVAPRDADSSRDRLSDASSRCSSGKGYICDSEGEDDKGSDASSVIFASTPASRKREFPGALPPSLPLSNGTSNSPVPAPTPPNLPVPSPAPAQQPPLHPPAAIPSAAVSSSAAVPITIPLKQPSSSSSTSTSVSLGGVPNNTTNSSGSNVVVVGGGGGTGGGSVVSPAPQPPVSVPVSSMPSVPVTTMPQPAAAPIAAHHPPPALDSTTGAANHAMRTDSPAVATSANVPVAPSAGQYHHPSSYQPLYAPYAVHTPYSQSPSGPATITANTMSSNVPTSVAAPIPPVTTRESTSSIRAPSPRIHSPARERDSYSSNVSSLSRGSVTPLSCPPPTTVSSSLAMSKPWTSASSAPQLSPAPPRPTPPLHSSFPPPMFTTPLPPVSRASPLSTTVQPPNPNPFSAESLFQTNQADMLRRELDNRFLASQDRSLGVAPPPYLRTEMHQHQHHHTHVHQHTTSLLPPPAASSLFPTPLTVTPMDRLARRPGSSDIPKLGSVESPFYRQNIGMPNYPGYTPGLMHPGLAAGPTPFVPPNHLPTFQPKSLPPDSTKNKPLKTGKWNAMHVRVAWEIYHHQQKSGETKGGAVKTDLLRPPSHLFSPSVHATRPHELSFPPTLSSHRPPGFDQPPHPSSLFTPPPSHLGKSPFVGSTMSPFTRYGPGFAAAAAAASSTSSPFGVSPFASARELSLGPLHDPWRGLQRTVPNFPPSVNALPPSLPGLPPPAPWSIKPDPIMEQREREAREREDRERERLRREREERERREREEKQRRLEQQQQQERERERREKERRELERREMEREREQRERLLHQQRMAESAAAAAAAKLSQSSAMRDRSPLRNGQPDHQQDGIRVKEEPRNSLPGSKEDELRYHPFLRHPLQPPPPSSVLDRARMLPHSLAHYPPPVPPSSHWPSTTGDPFYRYEPLRYNPLADVIRAEEERKLFSAYGAPPGHHPGQLRTKDPALMHLRPGPGPGPPGPPGPPNVPSAHKLSSATTVTPPTDLHKKEEPR